MDNEELVKNQAKFVRLVTTRYLGKLVGKLKEHLEASIANDRQCEKLKDLMTDSIYSWWNDIGDKLTENEANEASRKHWGSMGSEDPHSPIPNDLVAD